MMTPYKPQKALVTGGAGFIGSNLVHLLVEEGVEVRVLALPGESVQNLADVQSRVEVVTGDLLDVPSLERALVGCDTLFHLAAIYAVWLPKPRRMYDVNVTGTQNLMKAALRAGTPRIVHTSSIAAIGTPPGEAVANEEEAFNNWDVASDYVLSKYISELEVARLCREGLPAVIVNPAFPFGWGDIGPTPTGEIIQWLLRGFPFYMGGGFNAVGVQDVARGHWLAALNGQVGRRYILGGENVTYLDFAQRASHIAGVRAPRFRAPEQAFIWMGRIGEWVADHLTHRTPMAAESSVAYTAGRSLYVDIARAKQELGYEPAPLEHALADAVRWFKRGV